MGTIKREPRTLSYEQQLEHTALNAASRGSISREVFQQRYTDMLLNGFVSKGYVTVEYGIINISLAGVRRLLDLEGLPYD